MEEMNGGYGDEGGGRIIDTLNWPEGASERRTGRGLYCTRCFRLAAIAGRSIFLRRPPKGGRSCTASLPHQHHRRGSAAGHSHVALITVADPPRGKDQLCQVANFDLLRPKTQRVTRVRGTHLSQPFPSRAARSSLRREAREKPATIRP